MTPPIRQRLFTILAAFAIAVPTAGAVDLAGVKEKIEKRSGEFKDALAQRKEEAEEKVIAMSFTAAELKAKIDHYTSELERFRIAGEDLDALDIVDKELPELLHQISSIEQEIASARVRQHSKIINARAAAVGMKMAQFTDANGRRFEKVEIKEVTPKGVKFTHATGVSRIAPKDLPKSWKSRFQLGLPDPMKAPPKISTEHTPSSVIDARERINDLEKEMMRKVP